jgi:hypothetical protein
LRRARLLLEARALSEISRNDMALDILDGLEGPDVVRMRADVLWRAKRWREAGEAIERVLGDAWQGPAELDDAQRDLVLRAGIAYVLAEERLGTDRLRSKFAEKMADSQDARAFALVASQAQLRPRDFRDFARQVVSGDTLAAFLSAYRERYPDIAGPPRDPAARRDAARELVESRQAAEAPQPAAARN